VRIVWSLVAALLIASTPISAQQDDPPETADGFRRGTVEVSLVAGTTLPVEWLQAHSDRHATLTSIDFGRVVTNRVGPGPLAGKLQMLVSLTPVAVFSRPGSFTTGAAVSPLFLRWNFDSLLGRGAQFFAEGSAGYLHTESPPAGDSISNFLEQVGFGLRLTRNSGRRVLFGYRFQHVSNGGRTTQNPGSNYNFMYVGFSLLHRASNLSD